MLIGTQAVTDVDLAGEVVPPGHEVQNAFVLPEAYVPSGQALQDALPSSEYTPLPHGSQPEELVIPTRKLNVPAGHGAQEPMSPVEYVPGGQPHLVAPVELVVVPSGQGVQEAAPSVEYVPTGHSVHFVFPSPEA